MGVRAWTEQRALREWGPLALAFTVYTLGRAWVSPEDPTQALLNGHEIVALEREMGLFVEAALQDLLLVNDAAVWAFNTYYVTFHLPPVLAVLMYAYVRHPGWWPVVRDVFVTFSLLGLAGHALYPLAPPWAMEGLPITDTFAKASDPAAWKRSGLGNPFAAMPSMHLGWSLIAGAVLVTLGERWWLRVIGVGHPTVMGVAIVVTGNHYVLDATASLLLLSLVTMGALTYHQRARGPGGPGPEPDPPGDTPVP